MTTEKGREKRIADALHAYSEKPEPKDSLTLEWRNRQEHFPVVELPLESIVLNSNSHRLRAQLEDHGEAESVSADPWSEASQQIVADLIKTTHRSFAALKENLAEEGQRDSGIVTRKGILINANTRAVALRELAEEKHGPRYIRVAVLPVDADEPELAELELRLQVQKELKDPYTLTNELLFIEDLNRRYNKTPQQIAEDLRWPPIMKGLKKATAEVEQRLRILALVREMQRVPSKKIPLTFFDDMLQHLKELEGRYNALLKEDPPAAYSLRDNWLCVAAAGKTAVHDIRAVGQDFMEDYLRPHLEENPLLGAHVDQMLSPVKTPKRDSPAGVDTLDPGSGTSASRADVSRVLDVMISGSKLTIEQPDGKKITYSPQDVRANFASAATLAIHEVKQQGRKRNRLQEPITLMREAVTKLKNARSKYIAVSRDLGQNRRGRFEYEVKKAKQALSDLDKTIGSQTQTATARNGRSKRAKR